jgi:hypothetical protein
MSGLVLGILNAVIVGAILVLVGAIIVMIARWFQWPIDWNVQRLYLLVVLLIVLYLIVAVLLGLPHWRVISGVDEPFRAVATAAAAGTRPAVDHGA